jgi:RHS repeat-associated protein
MLLCFPLPILAQSPGKNYVLTETMLRSDGAAKVSSVQYCDGLGRPDIYVTDGRNANGTTAYTLTQYDFPNIVMKKWLPGVGGNTLDWKSPKDIMSHSKETNKDDSPFESYRYDVLDRPMSTIGTGQRWHKDDKKVCIMRYINRGCYEADKIARKYIVRNAGSTLSGDGIWEEGALSIESATDEDGKATMTFTDMYGNTVLERKVVDKGKFCDTYYVYDDRGLLRYVLSPMYQQDMNLEKYGYEYRYDNKMRCCYKRLPGCEPVRYWYDDLGNMIFMQDGELLKKGKCRFMLYDSMGRLAVQGICDNTPRNYASGVVTPVSGGICDTGYASQYITLSSPELETANYYDSYNFLSGKAFSCYKRIEQMKKSGTGYPIGMKTGSLMKASNGELLYSVMYYTEKGQVCDARMSRLGGKLLLQGTDYSFTGKPERTAYELRQDGRTDSVLLVCSYSPVNDALTVMTMSYNGGPACRISDLKYDDVGRLVSNTLPGTAGTILYDYNIRSAVTKIENKNYKETISYDGLYNGNISGVENTCSGDAGAYKYTFSYDNLNRLRTAVSSADNSYGEEVSYDLNGNILTLGRRGEGNNGSFGTVDSLSCTYDGNRILRISDSAGSLVYNGSFDFKPSGSKANYTFNANGSLTFDPDKGATFTYSDTGTPLSVDFRSGERTDYVYTADGTKLMTTWGSIRTMLRRKYSLLPNPLINVSIRDTSVFSPRIWDKIDTFPLLVHSATEYAGPFVIVDGKLDRILFDGGYCTVRDSQPKYHFYVRDHLGSIRVVVDEDGKVEQKTYYYPFGGIYGNVSAGTDVQPFKYNGKELDHRHGLDLYDYGARQYDAATGRWTTMDPLAEKYYSVSPYAYCHNNPVNGTDPDGKDDYYDRYGNYLGTNHNKTDFIYIADKFKQLGIWGVERYYGIYKRTALSEAELSAQTWSKILTRIAVEGGINPEDLHNGAISVGVLEHYNGNNGYDFSDSFNDNDNVIGEMYNYNNASVKGRKSQNSDALITAFIYPSDEKDLREYYSTVSNIQHLLSVHEYDRHYIKDMDDGYKLDKSLINIPLFKKTTPGYQQHILYRIKTYKQ